MKCLKDFQNDLNKCSKCGLCQSVCPLFKINPNDCTVSKGKFIMLHGVTKGELKLSRNINKYLDMCLKCGKCNDFCPSGIDVCQILNTAKYEYSKSTFFNRIIKIFHSHLVFSNIIKLFSKITKPLRPKLPSNQNSKLNVIYFKGCINKIYPKTDIYLNKILKNSDINVITPDFDCCGLPFLSEGNLERFIETAKYNLEKIKIDYDYLVTDCASCESTILDYKNYLESDIKNEKTVNWGDIIALKNLKFHFEKPIKVTFHKPCHLKNDAFFERIINNCENVQYVKMEDYDCCCGVAGTFMLKNKELSNELSKQKAQNIIKTGADIVITTCPACIFGLKYGLKKSKSNIKIQSLLEFLANGVKD